ncbi:hypothetical protein [Haloarcula sp. JP-L23]|uniref:hypothetical protein n=1 Tax=Haloarcula sp. JP-L23 TaxID=2716717 RepID=UPI00140EBA7B|nr:hypothetical protein G9465_03120 [Haloarcula sp. JP-L23]
MTDLEQIFDSLDGHPSLAEVSSSEMRENIVSVVAFLYSGFKSQGFGTDEFEDILEKGIKKAEAELHEFPDGSDASFEITQATVDIEIERYSGDDLALLDKLSDEYEINPDVDPNEVFEELVDRGLLERRDDSNEV